MLEQVGEAGAPGRLVVRADLVPDVDGDLGHAVVLVQDHLEAVRRACTSRRRSAADRAVARAGGRRAAGGAAPAAQRRASTTDNNAISAAKHGGPPIYHGRERDRVRALPSCSGREVETIAMTAAAYRTRFTTNAGSWSIESVGLSAVSVPADDADEAVDAERDERHREHQVPAAEQLVGVLGARVDQVRERSWRRRARPAAGRAARRGRSRPSTSRCLWPPSPPMRSSCARLPKPSSADSSSVQTSSQRDGGTSIANAPASTRSRNPTLMQATSTNAMRLRRNE